MAAETTSRTAAAVTPDIPRTCLIFAPIWGAERRQSWGPVNSENKESRKHAPFSRTEDTRVMTRALGLVKREALSKTERSAAGSQSFSSQDQTLINPRIRSSDSQWV